MLETSAIDQFFKLAHSFRYELLSYHTREKTYSTFAWQTLSQLSQDPDTLDVLLSDLKGFVRNIVTTSSRSISVLPRGCPGLCRDECLVVSILAASQQSACPALKVCAYALLESCSLQTTLSSAEKFGVSLKKAGVHLSPQIFQVGLTFTLLMSDQNFFHA